MNFVLQCTDIKYELRIHYLKTIEQGKTCVAVVPCSFVNTNLRDAFRGRFSTP